MGPLISLPASNARWHRTERPVWNTVIAAGKRTRSTNPLAGTGIGLIGKGPRLGCLYRFEGRRRTHQRSHLPLLTTTSDEPRRCDQNNKSTSHLRFPLS
jgi:hypothetical protein